MDAPILYYFYMGISLILKCQILTQKIQSSYGIKYFCKTKTIIPLRLCDGQKSMNLNEPHVWVEETPLF